MLRVPHRYTHGTRGISRIISTILTITTRKAVPHDAHLIRRATHHLIVAVTAHGPEAEAQQHQDDIVHHLRIDP